eukprot:scaffold271592_cov40-Prasinocladus_malaysianus.AAC.1
MSSQPHRTSGPDRMNRRINCENAIDCSCHDLSRPHRVWFSPKWFLIFRLQGILAGLQMKGFRRLQSAAPLQTCTLPVAEVWALQAVAGCPGLDRLGRQAAR